MTDITSTRDKIWESFCLRADKFVKDTEQFANEDLNPGGYYKAVWCRDAAYILKDWFLSGRLEDVMQELLFIWSHQISPSAEKVIYGRGSPEMRYSPQVASQDVHEKFQGALPTTIFRGFSEVYGRNPDIDSTALMISTTSSVLDSYLKSGMIAPVLPPEQGLKELKVSSVVTSPSTVIDYVVPRMLLATSFLMSRDTDGDGLLEQEHNEDWMDTVLREGNVLYSQACWILALGNLSSLLKQLKMDTEAEMTLSAALRAINAVEERLWSDKNDAYLDWHDGKAGYLTQDVALYVVAVTENTILDALSARLKGKFSQRDHTLPDFSKRANRTLDSLKKRIWKEGWPLVTESALERTGPWDLDPNQYHNHTLWPWTTGLEMLARSRLGRIEECNLLLGVLASTDSQSNIRALYEWVNPITDRGSGARPFRTGISAIRIAISDIFAQMGETRLLGI